MRISSAGPSAEWPELLAAAKQGDRDALGELLQLYWVPLWEQAAMRIEGTLQSKEAASDVVQETLLGAHLHIAEFRGTTPLEFQAWLRAMMINNIRDAWRRYSGTQKRRAAREVSIDSSDAGGAPQRGSSESLLDGFLRQEQAASVNRLLERLPEHYRAIIRLRHWEGMTFVAIAEVMGKSTDSVRQMWYRALEMFADMIGQEDAK